MFKSKLSIIRRKKYLIGYLKCFFKDLKNTKFEIKIISFFLLILFAIINFENLDIGLLQFFSIDEYAFHGSIMRIFDGFKTFNLKKIMTPGFVNYGYAYFFLNFLVSLPFMLLEKTELIIYIPRMISAFFAVASFFYYAKICEVCIKTPYRYTCYSLCILIPGFWINGAWFHPDWVMTCFLIISVYFLIKDNFKFGIFYMIGLIMYAISIGVKIQAIEFMPIFLLYILKAGIYSRTVKNKSIRILKEIFILTLVIFIIFVLFNPTFIIPAGFKNWINFFIENMISNKTNHGLGGEVAFLEKISIINKIYINYIFQLILLIISVLAIVKYKLKNIICILVLGTFIVLLYNLFLINKAWQHYYLPIVFMEIIIIPMYLAQNYTKILLNFILAAIILQFLTIYQNKVSLINYRYDKNNISYVEFKNMNKVITNVLEKKITSSSKVLISPYTPIDYTKYNIKYSDVNLLWGDFLDDDEGIIEDFIVINKKRYSSEMRSNMIPENLEILKQELEKIEHFKENKKFQLLFEDKNLLIFKNKGI